MEISFSELRAKTVVNLTDGRRLGHIIDLIFDQNTSKILGVVVPGGRGGLFKGREDLFIPYHCICKIGLDTILVELSPVVQQSVNSSNQISQYSDRNTFVIEPNDKSEKARKYTQYSPDNY